MPRPTPATSSSTTPAAFSSLGIVKGFGGAAFAAGAAVLALVGALVWARRVGRRTAGVWLAILAVTVVQLVWLQNRRFPRYAAPLQEAAAPLFAAAAAAAAPPIIAAGGLAALGAAWAIAAWPPVLEQHRTHLPGWAAVQVAVAEAKRTGEALVVEPGLYPFLSYREELDRAAGRPWTFKWYLAPASPDAKALPTGPYVLLTDYPFHYFGSLSGRSERFPTVSDRLRPLTQGRFLNVMVGRDVPLPVRGWWLPERPPGAPEKFMWGGRDAEFLIPPLPPGAGLALDFVPFPGPAPLDVVIDGTVALTVPGDARRALREIGAGFFPPGRTSRLVFRRADAYLARPRRHPPPRGPALGHHTRAAAPVIRGPGAGESADVAGDRRRPWVVDRGPWFEPAPPAARRAASICRRSRASGNPATASQRPGAGSPRSRG